MSDVNKVFDNKEIRLDGQTFKGCTFNGCTLVFGGGHPPSLVENVFNRCSWKFDGEAANTLAFLAALRADGGKEFVEAVIRRAGAANG